MSRDTPPDRDRQRSRGFPDARSVHGEINSAPEEYPKGWVEQVRFRERYDLPSFRPPRFADGKRVREVVRALEAEHGITLSFVSDGESSGEWIVEIDGRDGFRVARRRDDASNTVVEMTAADFRDRVEEHL
ncbi:hypothetical protein BRC86_01875 [Halobacteriales archaeon QS_3_64_16]|nr:MAG: hypothetical protein BRC86_01875 [Halobacteriales archaeon QS_3_64_16]